MPQESFTVFSYHIRRVSRYHLSNWTFISLRHQTTAARIKLVRRELCSDITCIISSCVCTVIAPDIYFRHTHVLIFHAAQLWHSLDEILCSQQTCHNSSLGELRRVHCEWFEITQHNISRAQLCLRNKDPCLTLSWMYTLSDIGPQFDWADMYIVGHSFTFPWVGH